MNFLLGLLGPRWVLHILPYIAMAILGFAIYQKLIAPSSSTSTKIGHVEKQVNVYQSESPKQDLFSFGCSNARVEGYWKKNRIIKNE